MLYYVSLCTWEGGRPPRAAGGRGERGRGGIINDD